MKKTLSTLILLTAIITQGFTQSFYPTYPSQSDRRSTSQTSSYGTYGTATQTNQNTRSVDGYTRSNGTYVQPYTRTESNGTNLDNYSTQGNTNPYTQQQGTRAADYSTGAYNYGQGKQIQTGERGGQYYINSNGNRTYVPKRNPY